MTLYGLLASLAWTATAVLFIARAELVVRRWIDRLHAPDAGLTPAVVIPPDLEGFALLETEKWAQEQTMAVIRERFDALKDWNKVRHAIGVAEVSA